MVAPELIVGIRRLPPRGWRHRRQYEVRFRDGGSASCSFSRLDDVLDGRRFPADFWVTVGEADKAFQRNDGAALIAWPSGAEVTTLRGPWPPAETISRDGTWVRSSAGYCVRSKGRAGLEYVDEDGPLDIDSEWMAEPALVIYRASIRADRTKVLDRVARLWLWCGFDVDLDPPLPVTSA